MASRCPSKMELLRNLFKLNVRIPAGTQITIVVPPELTVLATDGGTMPTCIQNRGNFPVNSNNDTLTNCNYNFNLPDQTITYTVLTPISSISQYTFYFGPIRNPTSCLQISSFTVTFTNGNPSSTGTITSGLDTITYTPASLVSATVSPISVGAVQAGAADTYTFIFQIKNKVPIGGFITITFPSPNWVSAPTITSATCSIYGSTGPTITATKSGLDVLISGMFTSAVSPDPVKFLSITLGVTNPNVLGATPSFILTTMDINQLAIDQASSGLIITVNLSGTLIINSFTSSSTVIEQQTYLTFTVKPSVKYNSGGYVEIIAPYPYITKHTSGGGLCYTQFGFTFTGQVAASKCITSKNSYTVDIYQDLLSTATVQTFYILYMINPLAALTLPSFVISYNNPDGTVVASNSTGSVYTTVAGTCTLITATRVSPTFQVAATTAIYDLSFWCPNRIMYNQNITILIPIDQMAYNPSMLCFNGPSGAAFSPPCSVAMGSSGVHINVTAPQWMTASPLVTDFISSPTNPITIRFKNAFNPPYIAPTSSMASVEIYIKNNITTTSTPVYYTVDQLKTGIIFSGSLTPGPLTVSSVTKSSSFGASSSLTGGASQYTIALTTTTVIPKSGYLMVVFPWETVYDPGTTSTCAPTPGTSGNCQITLNSTNPGSSSQVLYANVTTICPNTGGCSSTQAFSIVITNLLNSFTTFPASNFSYSFSTFTSLGYLIDTGSFTIPVGSRPTALSPNALTVTLPQPAGTIMTGDLDTYQFAIVNSNNYIPATSGSILITLSSEVTVKSGATCTALSGSTSLSCVFVSGKINVTTSSSSISKGSTITVTVSSFIYNPPTGKPSTTFTIQSFHYGQYGIDINSALTVTCNTPNAVYGASSVRDLTQVNQAATLTLCFMTTNVIPQSALIDFLIPDDQETPISGTTATITFTPTSPSGSSVTTTSTQVTISGQKYNKFTVTEWCSGGSASCAAATTYCATEKGLVNPSTSSISVNSIIINVTTSSSPTRYIVDMINLSLITTPYISLALLTINSITRDTDIVGRTPTYTFNFNLNSGSGLGSLTGLTNPTAILAFPVNFVFQTNSPGLTCKIGNSNPPTTATTCSITNNAANIYGMGTYIQSLSLPMKCTTISCGDGATIVISLTGTAIYNAYDTRTMAGGVITIATQYSNVIKNANSYTIGSSSGNINDFTTDAFSLTTVARSVTGTDQNVILTFALTMPTRLRSSGFIQITFALSQVVSNGQLYAYQTGTSLTAFSTTNLSPIPVSSTSTSVVMQLPEWCDGGAKYCPDSTTIYFRFTSGFKNARFIPSSYNYFDFTSQTPDGYSVDYTSQTAAVMALQALTPAAITVSQFYLSLNETAQTGISLTLVLQLNASHTNTDKITIAFSKEFVRTDNGAPTCGFDSSSGSTTKTCTYVQNSFVLQSLTISNFCPSTTCSGSLSYTLKINNLVNILQLVSFTGTATVNTYDSSNNQIASATVQLSGYPKLSPGALVNVAVTRSSPYQNALSTYLITFQTPVNGVLLPNSFIEIWLPFDQILMQTTVTTYDIKTSTQGTVSLTQSVQAGNSTHYVTRVAYGNCTGASNCLTQQTITLYISSSKNPYLTSTNSYNNFIFYIVSSTFNQIFYSPPPVLANPLLTYGKLLITTITHDISSQVNDQTGYTFTFTTTTDMPALGQFKFQFPDNRVYKYASSSLTCTLSSVTQTSVAYFKTNAASQPVLTINITSACSTATSCLAGTYTVSCQGNMMNPPSVPKSFTTNFTVTTSNNLGNIIDQGTVFNNFTTAIIPKIIAPTITRQSQLLSIETPYTIEFTTKNIFPDTGFVYIFVPLDQITLLYTSGSIPCSQQSGTLSCSVIFSNSTLALISVQNTFCPADCPANMQIDIILSGVQNPGLFTANSVTSTWQVYTTNSNKEYIDGLGTGIQASPKLLGRNVIVLDASLDSPIVYTETYLRLVMQTGTYMDSTALFDVYFPDGLFSATSKFQCNLITTSSIGFHCKFSNFPSGYLQMVTLYQPCPFTCDDTTAYIYQIPVITRGDTYQVGGSFEVVTRFPNTDVGQGFLGNVLSLTAAQIVDTYIGNNNCDTIDDTCTIYFSFKQISPIPTKANNGRIFITYPPEIFPISTGCGLTIDDNSYSSTCLIDKNARSIIATHGFTGLLIGRNVTIKMYLMKNPSSTAPTSDFDIRTQQGHLINSKLYYYDIDYNASGVYYKINTTTPFLSAKVTRDPMLNGNGYLTGQPTILTFELVLNHALSSQAQFKFQFPNASQVMFSPTITGYSCYSVDSSYKQQNVLLCSQVNETIIVQNLCFVQTCTAKSTIRFRVFDDLVQNFYYVVTPLDATNDSLKVWSTTSDGNYYIDSALTSLNVTPELQPSSLIMPSPEIIRTNNVVMQETSWNLYFKINKNPIPQHGYVTIQVPQGILFLVSGYDLQIAGSDTDTYFENMTYTAWSDGSVNLITIYDFCDVHTETNGTCSIGNSYSLRFDNIQNPPSQFDVNLPIIAQTYTPEGYIVERGTTPSCNKLFSQLVPLKIAKVVIMPVNPIPAKVTDYQIYISNNEIPFNSSDYIQIKFPIEITLLNQSYSSRLLASSATRCTSIFEPSIGLTCSVVDTNLLQVNGMLNSTIDYYGIKVKDLLNPSKNMTTQPVQVTIFNYQGLSIASRTTQTRVTIYPVMDPNANCSKVCNTCAGSNSTCTSCNVPSAYPLLKDYSCIDKCGDGYFFDENSLRCYPCHVSCASCYGPGINKCIACATNYLNENGVCVQNCKAGYLENSATMQCQSPNSLCDSTCKTCSTNPSFCLSCDKNNSLHSVYDRNTGKCIANNHSLCNGTVSTRFYIDQTTLSCEQCTELCHTCTEKSTICTSCQSFFSKNMVNDLYQTCVDKCGLGTFYSNKTNICSWCNPICLLCTGHGANECLVCNKTPEGKQLYFLKGQCVVTCPKGYKTDLTINACTEQSIDYISFPYFFVGLSIIITLVLFITSTFLSKFKHSYLDVLYAQLSIIEALNRAALLGNLWVKSSVFTLAVCFMNMIATAAIGVFFNFLFMSPIYAHSPHFRTLYKQHTWQYQFATFLSYIGGTNVMRIMTSKFLGLKAFSSDLSDYKFYFQPLNTMANFTCIFTLAQLGICVYCVLMFTLYDDLYILGAFGLALNLIFLSMQVLKHFLTKAKTVKYDRDHAQTQAQRR